MYERIGRHRLAAHALRLGFLRPLLRVAIRPYRLPRLVSLNGACARGAWPARGVVAKVVLLEGGDA